MPRFFCFLILSNLCRCDNELYGCTVVVKLDILAMHLKECEHNPKKPVPCASGCGLTVPKDEMVRTSLEYKETTKYRAGRAQLRAGAASSGPGPGREHLQGAAGHDRHAIRAY